MGELWLARAQDAAGTERHVAIKTILPHLNDQEEFVERFLDEARIATTLTHGNIVHVFELGQDDGTWFLAMEYVDGWDLRTILRRARAHQEKIPANLALHIVAETCKGLDYAHKRRDEQKRELHIVHRDISPANLLISREGEVRIVDFGIASAQRRLNQTITGELRGKFAYMSPEQASGHPLDRRSDIFSLGVVLYEMLAGCRPFEGESDLEVLGKVQRAQYQPLQTLRPELPREIHDFLAKALAPAPSERFQSALEMGEAAQQLLHQAPTPTTAGELATFCLRFDRPTFSTGNTHGGAFDALLLEQLDAAQNDDGRNATPSWITPSEKRKARTTTTPKHIAASAIATAAKSGTARTDETATVHVPAILADEPTRTIRVDRRAIVRRKRLWWAIGVVTVLIVITSILAFRAGSRSASTAPLVRISTEPDGALVLFNGVSYGRSTLVARLEPGEFLLRAELAGYQPEERHLFYEGKEDLSLHLVLTPEDTPPAPTQTVAIESDPPGARFRVNGGPWQRGGSSLTLPLGETLTFDFELEGYAALTQEHRIEPGEARFTQRLEPLTDDENNRTLDAPTPADGDDAPNGTTRNHTAAQETRVAIGGLPPNAALWVDGERQASARSAKIPRRPGVTLHAEAPGFQPTTRRIDGRSAERQISITLQPLAQGTLTVRYIGDIRTGEIFVNGRSYGFNTDSPRKQIQLNEGTWRVTVRNEEFSRSEEHDVDIRAGEESVLRIDW